MSNEEIFQKLQQLVEEQFSAHGEITMETSFVEDLNVDSIDRLDLVMAIEEEFDIGEIQEEDVPNLKTMGDVVQFIAGRL